jgi:hypothetical protein
MQFLGFAGCLCVFFGSFLPLIGGNIGSGDGGTQPFVGPNAWAIGLGNTLLAFTAMAVLFLCLNNFQGVIAVGVALIALTVPLLWQIKVEETSDLLTIANFQRQAQAAKLGFGWTAWCLMFVGAVVVTASGVAQLRARSAPGAKADNTPQ